MNRQLIRVLALLLVSLPFAASAKIQAPDHVIYGNATLYGDNAPLGSVIELRRTDGELLARYALGSEPRLGRQFALYIPMDTVDPRRDGYARKGDPIEIFIGAQLAARTQVGDEGVAVRLDIDPQNLGTGPAVRVLDVAVMEGNSGISTAQFTISMNTTSPSRVVTVNWQTVAGTATAATGCGAGSDFVTASGALDIPAGQLSGQVNIQICGDTTIEPDEMFAFELTSTVDDFGVIQTPSATGTILDDDDLPQISVADARVLEPATGTAVAKFTATLSRSATVDVQFDYATAPGSATSGADFTATSGTATIVAGELTTDVLVNVLADASPEPQETFRLTLSNPHNAGIATTLATATIVDPAYNPALTHDDDITSEDDANNMLVQPSALALSPDGRHVYATSEALDAVLVFSRDTDGSLHYVADYTGTLLGAPLDGAHDIVVSPDGLHVYVAASGDDAVVAFSRDSGSGALTLVGDVRDNLGGASGLKGVTALAISPDGRHLYAAGHTDSTVAVFGRDAGSGALSFIEAETDGSDDAGDVGPEVVGMDRPSAIMVSPDGQQVYVTAAFGNAVVTFSRTDASATPDDGKLSFVTSYRDGLLGIDGLAGASDMVLSPDGLHLYVTGEAEDAIVLFDRQADGSLIWRQLWRRGGVGLVGMDGPHALALSPDGAEMYVTGLQDDSLTVLSRTLTPNGGSDPVGNLKVRQTLFDDEGGNNRMAGPTDVVASPDSQNIYVLANIDNAIVILHRTAFDRIFTGGFED